MNIFILETWVEIVAFIIPIIKIAPESLWKIDWNGFLRENIALSLFIQYVLSKFPVLFGKDAYLWCAPVRNGNIISAKNTFRKQPTNTNYKLSPKKSNIVTTAAANVTWLLKNNNYGFSKLPTHHAQGRILDRSTVWQFSPSDQQRKQWELK